MTMMVVDDDVLARMLMTLSLEELGFHQVLAETTGAAALMQLDAGVIPTVIFCDLQMPGMDGVQLLRHLASRQFSGGVILLSGSDWRILKTCEEMGQALGMKMLGILQKPFDTRAICKLLLRVNEVRSEVQATVAPISPAELLQGLQQDQIEAWFQPQLSTQNRHPIGMEVLARWRHPERGLISPLAFITLAEECGLIDRVMQVMFRGALAAMGTLRDAGNPVRMAINFSALNLHDPTLPEQLERMTRAASLSPGDLMIEITESGVAQSKPLALEILSRLRLKGFGLSIDDFATGYSSMAQLHRLPFTELKVDKAFVHDSANDLRSYAMFESSVLLARKLGVVSVAEGVETEEDMAVARQLGCDVVQGYLFAKAMSLPDLQVWLAGRDAPVVLAA